MPKLVSISLLAMLVACSPGTSGSSTTGGASTGSSASSGGSTGGGFPSVTFGTGGHFQPVTEISAFPYLYGDGALLEILDAPMACGEFGLGDAGQTILIALYETGDGGSIGATDAGPFAVVVGSQPGGERPTRFANLTYEEKTSQCPGETRTYYATSGTVTVTALGSGGIQGSFSATAYYCGLSDAGAVTLGGSFSTTDCPSFHIAQCQTNACP